MHPRAHVLFVCDYAARMTCAEKNNCTCDCLRRGALSRVVVADVVERKGSKRRSLDVSGCSGPEPRSRNGAAPSCTITYRSTSSTSVWPFAFLCGLARRMRGRNFSKMFRTSVQTHILVLRSSGTRDTSWTRKRDQRFGDASANRPL